MGRIGLHISWTSQTTNILAVCPKSDNRYRHTAHGYVTMELPEITAPVKNQLLVSLFTVCWTIYFYATSLHQTWPRATDVLKYCGLCVGISRS